MLIESHQPLITIRGFDARSEDNRCSGGGKEIDGFRSRYSACPNRDLAGEGGGIGGGRADGYHATFADRNRYVARDGDGRAGQQCDVGRSSVSTQ